MAAPRGQGPHDPSGPHAQLNHGRASDGACSGVSGAPCCAGACVPSSASATGAVDDRASSAPAWAWADEGSAKARNAWWGGQYLRGALRHVRVLDVGMSRDEARELARLNYKNSS